MASHRAAVASSTRASNRCVDPSGARTGRKGIDMLTARGIGTGVLTGVVWTTWPLPGASWVATAARREQVSVRDRDGSSIGVGASIPHREPRGRDIAFEPNHGQTDPQVRFLSRAPGYTLFLTQDEAVLALRSQDGSDGGRTAAVLRVRMRAANPNPSVRVIEEDRLPGKSHYFTGNDPTRWRTNISQYRRVTYDDVYPDVQLVYHGNEGQLEYDFVIAPGGDARAIELEYVGSRGMRIDADGALVIQVGGLEVRQPRPIAYQERDGVREYVSARYILKRRTITFELAPFDRSRPLVIDPVVSLSSFLGGSADDVVNGLAMDSSGSVYLTGETGSADFPTTAGVVQGANGGGTDVFVTKLDASGASVLYSTYLGGAGADRGSGISVDATGAAHVTGRTGSTDFPVTDGALQTSHLGDYDAFVTKLSADGSALAYSTFLGGSINEAGYGLVVDGAGNAYVVGSTSSPDDFPVTPDAFQTVYGGGIPGNDTFVSKLNEIGTALMYSTYLGGDFVDRGNSIAIDADGNAYVAGWTDSPNFPIANAVQPVHGGGRDAFVTKLNPGGTALVYSTFLGGTSEDGGLGIAVDGVGSPYVTGYTESADFPVASAFQATFGGLRDAFVTKLASDGSAFAYSTFLGGTGAENLVPVAGLLGAIAVDGGGAASIVGGTRSTDFPVVDAFQATFGGVEDAFVTKLNAAGTAAIYSSYMGGSLADGATAIVLGQGELAYVAGQTFSPDFPVVNAFQPTHAGGSDGFVAAITVGGGMPGADVSVTKTDEPDPVAPGQELVYVVGVSNAGPEIAYALTLSDEVPANTTFVSIEPAEGWSCTSPPVGEPGPIGCSAETVAPTITDTLSVVVRVNDDVADGTTISSTVSVSAVTADPNLANNSAATTTTVSSPGTPGLTLELIATGLPRPVAITNARDGSGRLFITLQRGLIVIYDGSQVLPTPFLDITSLVFPIGGLGDERGLLSVAFHPNYASNGYFYVNYVNTDNDTVIARYSVSATDPNVADPASAEIILTIDQPSFPNHKGGQIQFGPEGYLYVATGDGGSAGDPGNRAQNPLELLGKMLRIDVDAASPYAIPPDNPCVGHEESCRPEIWAFGLRNPWRFSFDRATGDLFIGDVGQNRFEEINYQPASSGGGQNYGWRLMEANACFNPPADCNDGTLTLPILEYDRSLGIAVTGGYVYRGVDSPLLTGLYFFADYGTGRLWVAWPDEAGTWSSVELVDTSYAISTFGEDEAGELYFAAHALTDGAVYRIVSKSKTKTQTKPKTKPKTKSKSKLKSQ
jgi:uncharacterized repeat protein (TIGR01451 family)